MTVYLAQSNSGTTTGTTASVTLPTWTATGDEDLILLWVSAVANVEIDPPTGYSSAIADVAGQSPGGVLFYKYASSAGTDSGATVNVPLSPASVWIVQARVYIGSFIDLISNKNGSASTSGTFTAVTPQYGTSDGAIAVEFFTGLPGSGQTDTLSVPSGYGNNQATASTKSASANLSSGSWDNASALTAGSSYTASAVTQSVSVVYTNAFVSIVPTDPTVPYIRATSDGIDGTTSPAAIPVPFGIDHTKGDVVVVALNISWPEGTVAPTNANITPPSGFTAYNNISWVEASGEYIYNSFWYKYPTANDTGTYSFSWVNLASQASDSFAASAFLVRNAQGTNPFVDTFQSTSSTSGGSTLTLSAFTPAADKSLILINFISEDNALSSTSSQLTMLSLEAPDGAAYIIGQLGKMNQKTAGTTGSMAFNRSTPSASVIVGTVRAPLALTSLSWFRFLPSDPSLEQNLYGEWLFTAASLSDTSGNSNNGTAQGTITAATGHTGISSNAYSFNGTSGYIYTAASVTNPNTFSLCAWFKTTVSGPLVTMVSPQVGAPVDYDRSLYINTAGNAVFASNFMGQTVTSTSSYNDGNWHFAVGVQDASTGMTLYVDGVSVGTPNVNNFGQNFTGYWRIGNASLGGAGSDTFNGIIDDVRVYSIALTSTQINELYSM